MAKNVTQICQRDQTKDETKKKILPLLAEKHLMTKDDKERIEQLQDDRTMSTEILSSLMKLKFNPLQQLKIAFIKTAQS